MAMRALAEGNALRATARIVQIEKDGDGRYYCRTDIIWWGQRT
jgi:hypothetical protein